MEKIYSLAGTSKIDGIVTYRFASGDCKVRERILRKNGHDEIKLLETPRPMTLKDCIAWLATQGVRAVLPHGQRKLHYGKFQPEGVQLDAHVQSWQAAEAAAAEKLAAKRARDAARKRERRAALRAAA